MNSDDIFILYWAVGVFALLCLGVMLMLEYEDVGSNRKDKD